MKVSTLEGAAFCLILGLGACADGLADMPGGMAVLIGGAGVAGLLVHLAHSRDWNRERKRTAPLRRAEHGLVVPLHPKRKRPTEGKRKAAAVVTTPQRQAKQTGEYLFHTPILPGGKEIVNLDFKMIEALLLSTKGFTGSIDGELLSLKGAQYSTQHLRAELKKAGLDVGNSPESLDEALVAVEAEYERQGFISGFRMGVQLMAECVYHPAGGDPA